MNFDSQYLCCKSWCDEVWTTNSLLQVFTL